MHPGTQPNAWAEEVLTAVAATADDVINAAIQEALAAQ
jgi:hypothetical protein